MSLRSVFSASGRKLPSERSRTSSVYATTDCKRCNHPEFQIRVSNNAMLAEDISCLLRFFEQRVAHGVKFRSGESLQVGWMFTMLEDGPEGFLRVLEPDMKVKFFAVPAGLQVVVDGAHRRTWGKRRGATDCRLVPKRVEQAPAATRAPQQPGHANAEPSYGPEAVPT